MKLFDSDLDEERDFVKHIIYTLYSKLIPRRKMMRKSFTDFFYQLIHENNKFNGISELLDIMVSIISGYEIPLREHINFFKNILIPLHKLERPHLYFDNLSRCSLLFLTKDKALCIPLLDGILKYWPFSNSLKETLFLKELPEKLNFCDVEKVNPLVNKLFDIVIKCISGNDLQVADLALCLFENDYFISIIMHYKTIVFNILVPSVNNLAANHWNIILKESLNALKEILQQIDQNAYSVALENSNQ